MLATQQSETYKSHRPETMLLYQLVERYYPDFIANLAEQGKFLPKYVEREFEDDKLRILNTHKGLKQYERIAQFAQLESVVDELIATNNTPFLVAGDFNEWQFFPRSLRAINQNCELYH